MSSSQRTTCDLQHLAVHQMNLSGSLFNPQTLFVTFVQSQVRPCKKAAHCLSSALKASERRVHLDELTTYHVADSNLKNKDTPPEAHEKGLSGDDTSYEVCWFSMLTLSLP